MFITDLSILARYSRTFFERRLSDINIGFTEQLILMYLCKSDTVNQDTIAKHFMLDKGAIAKTLNKLEEKGLIKRCDNPSNKREKLVSITSKTQDVIGHVDEELQEWHKCLFEGLERDEIDQLTKTISKISANAIKVINGRNLEDDEKE
jgi:Transcriptional regulators